MNADIRPAFGKGVRLRREPDGSAMLLVPEGALMLNPTAAAALELLDGERSVAEIATQMAVAFDVTEDQAREDVGTLFARLAERRLIVT
ncbi:MAG: pyrroloquinoline quinone biosynthesis peptide chaperone PqqD [Vulcanimicrobiaceae bacterium]